MNHQGVSNSNACNGKKVSTHGLQPTGSILRIEASVNQIKFEGRVRRNVLTVIGQKFLRPKL